MADLPLPQASDVSEQSHWQHQVTTKSLCSSSAWSTAEADTVFENCLCWIWVYLYWAWERALPPLKIFCSTFAVQRGFSHCPDSLCRAVQVYCKLIHLMGHKSLHTPCTPTLERHTEVFEAVTAPSVILQARVHWEWLIQGAKLTLVQNKPIHCIP